MAALVEVHTEAEMQIALDAGATLIGINSRDLNTFVTDLGTVERLAAMVPAGVTLVAESGIKTPAGCAACGERRREGHSGRRNADARAGHRRGASRNLWRTALATGYRRHANAQNTYFCSFCRQP